MSKESGFGGVVEKVLATGNKAADASAKISTISLEAAKKTLHSQIAFTSALAGFGAEQLRSLASLSSPAAFLQRQKEVGESLTGKLNDYIESLREIGVEAQEGYSSAVKDFAADLGLKAS